MNKIRQAMRATDVSTDTHLQVSAPLSGIAGIDVAEIRVTRRHLIKHSGLAAGGLSLATFLPGCGSIVRQEVSGQGDWHANAWLTLGADGSIEFTLDRVEMGQGTYTGLVTLLAEELEVAPEQVTVVFAGADQQYRNPDYGLQLTGGSNSLSSSWMPLRELGATTREMMLAAASDVFQVPVNYLHADKARVVHTASGKEIKYADLVALAAKQDVPEEVRLKASEQFKYIGKTNARLDSRAKVRGEAGFGIDARLENMLFAVVVRSPYIGGQLLRHNGAQLLAEQKALQVVEIGSGVAILANSYWQARKAADALEAVWQKDERTPESSDAVFALYREQADADAGDHVRSEGDTEEAFESAEKVLELEYQAPFLAHATMEPMNCVAQVRDGRADIWAGTQAPDLAQVVVAKVTDLSLDEVHIHNQFLGGGFGRRLSQDFIAEAAEIAYKAGVPVKLVWSREDDMQHDLYRPASLHRLKAALDENGQVSAWDHQIVCPKVMDWYVWDAAPAMFPWAPKFMYGMLGHAGLMTEGTPMTPADRSPYEGAEDLPYDIASIDVRHTRADAGVPVSYWRSVGHSHNAFVTEAFMEELAEAAGQDVFEFKRAMLNSSPRLKQVLELAAEKGQWGRELPPGRFQGIAAHKSFGSYVAELVELEVVNGQIAVHKVVCAIDCGTVVNPDIVAMQMESCIVFGLTAALYGDISILDGQIQQSNFHDYAMVRMNEAPAIEVHIQPSSEAPTGVGEPGLPPLAPAMAGALYRATGKRFRSMPFKLV